MILAALRHAIQNLRRGLRAGDLRVLALALAIAAAVAGGVGLFTERVQVAIERSTGDALGADAVVKSGEPLATDVATALRARVERSAAVVEFPSVVAFGDATQLSSVKSVEAGYPLRGQLLLADAPFAAAHVAPGIPHPGEIWVDPKLWTTLGLSPGAKVQVGSMSLAVTGVISDEPGRSGVFADLAPETLMNAQDLAATQLVGPGSRVQFTLLLAGSAAQLAGAKSVVLPLGARFVTPADARPEIAQTLQRARQFLNIAVLATLLLVAAAVALSSRQYSARLRDEVALLKTLGARRGFLLRSLVLQLLLLGLSAGGAGLCIGAAAQALVGRIIAPLLGVDLPMPGPTAVFSALAVVLLMLAGFALPPVASALDTPPVRVFQRATTVGLGARASAFAALLAVAALLWLQAGDAKLAGFIALGALLTAGTLALLAWLLVRALAPLRSRTGVAWRFGIGNLARRGPTTIAQTVALGVALLSLLLVTLVRQDMLATWKNRLPPETPNVFAVNIQPAQVDAVRAFLAAHGQHDLKVLPLVRAHLTALNGRAVNAQNFTDPETRSWINHEFNLSWIDRFDTDNEVVSGSFWTAADRGKPWISVDEEAVKRLNLKLGDVLEFDIAGQKYTLTVHDTRKVHWDSFKPNFFLMTPPGVLEVPPGPDLPAAPVQWITSFYLPPGEHALLRDLSRQFPNVTAFDLDSILNQVRSIVDRVVRALEFVLSFTLFAGLVVMLAVIEGSKAERVRETGVLRALGASSRVVLQGLLAEYAVLGLLAGTVAAAAAQGIAWALATQVFELPYGPRPLIWLAGSGAGCLIVTATGYFSLRGVLRTPPREVLAAAA